MMMKIGSVKLWIQILIYNKVIRNKLAKNINGRQQFSHIKKIKNSFKKYIKKENIKEYIKRNVYCVLKTKMKNKQNLVKLEVKEIGIMVKIINKIKKQQLNKIR